MSGDRLRLEYIPLEVVAGWRWERNPKAHDLAAVAASIRRYGMKDPLKFEPLLNGGRGGVVEGNGRLQALLSMFASGQVVPRGVGYDDEGGWYVGVLFGADAVSQAQAEAYGIAHNQITVAGGDYTWNETLRMWEDSYAELILDLASKDAIPVSMDGDDVDRLLSAPPNDAPREPTNEVYVEQDLTALEASVFRAVFLFGSDEAEDEFYKRLGVLREPGRILYRWADINQQSGQE